MIPKNCKTLVADLADHGWNFVLQHGKDTGGSPFVSIEGRRENDHLMVTWHTRNTGIYRLFTCMVNKRDLPLSKAVEKVTA